VEIELLNGVEDFYACISRSASGERPGTGTLIVGVNWLGDSIMTMPAIQTWRRAHPAARLVMLVKPKLKALWTLHPAVIKSGRCRRGGRDLAAMVRAARAEEFETAFVLPHSFRSAWFLSWRACQGGSVRQAMDVTGC